jgi:hypothetical protein
LRLCPWRGGEPEGQVIDKVMDFIASGMAPVAYPTMPGAAA